MSTPLMTVTEWEREGLEVETRRGDNHDSIMNSIKMTWIANLFKSRNNDHQQYMPEKSLVPKNLVDWKPLGRLPRARLEHTEVRKIIRINRYLTWQENRILQAAQNKQFNKVVLIWCMILKNSISYQLVLFNKIRPDWYRGLSRRDALRLLQRVSNKCRRWDLKLMLKRFYVPKKNGKWRPIGAPSYDSRAISRAFNDMIYLVFIDKFKTFQHGFRIKRGTHTALFEVWYRHQVLGETQLMEFDFIGYFNTVRPTWVFRYLLGRSKHLAELMIKIIYNIHYEFEDIKDERELRIRGTVIEEYKQTKNHNQLRTWLSLLFNLIVEFRGNISLNKERLMATVIGIMGLIFKTKGKNIIVKKERKLIVREGLPQGLSVSPLLSTLVLELLKAPKGLVMYADDGIHMTKDGDHSEFMKWVAKIGYFGIKLAPEKSGIIKGIFKFLGVYWDFDRKEVKFGESTKSWAGKDVMSEQVQREMAEWFQKVAQWYGKQSKGWYWDIHREAFAKKHYSKLPFFDMIRTVMYSWWTGRPLNGHRYFIGSGIYEVTKLSTMCCEEIIGELKTLKLRKLKPLNLVESGKFENWSMKKNDYFEEMYENSLREFTRQILPDWPNVHETVDAVD